MAYVGENLLFALLIWPIENLYGLLCSYECANFGSIKLILAPVSIKNGKVPMVVLSLINGRQGTTNSSPTLKNGSDDFYLIPLADHGRAVNLYFDCFL